MIAICAIPHLGLSVTPQAAVTSFVTLGSFGLIAAAALGRVDLSELLFVSVVFSLALPTTLAVCRAEIDRGVRKMKAKAHARIVRKSTGRNRGVRHQRSVTTSNGARRRLTDLLKSKGQDDAIDIFNHFECKDPRYVALLPWAVNLECVERMDKPVRSPVS